MCIYVIICDKKPISATSHLIEVFLVSHQSIAISLVSFRQLWLLWFIRFHPSRHDRFCYQASVVANNLCSYGSLFIFMGHSRHSSPPPGGAPLLRCRCLIPAPLPLLDGPPSSRHRPLLRRTPPPRAAVPLVADPGTGAARCKLLVSPPSIPRCEILAS